MTDLTKTGGGQEERTEQNLLIEGKNCFLIN